MRSYEDLCRRWGTPAWPATVQTLAAWITARTFGSMGQGRIQATTLASYFSALRSVHVDMALPVTVFDEEHLRRMLAGAHHAFVKVPAPARLSLSRDLLLRLLTPEAVAGEPYIDTVNLNAAFTLAFAGFLRIGEFTYKEPELREPALFNGRRLTPACITFSANGDHMTLLLRRSKADRLGEGVRILIAAADDEACPVARMRSLMAARPEPPPSGHPDPLFILRGAPFTRDHVLRRLRSRLARIRADVAGIKGHSFRKGAAQHAANQGLTREEIQVLGRWSSDAVDRYFRTSLRRRYALQRQFATGMTPALS